MLAFFTPINYASLKYTKSTTETLQDRDRVLPLSVSFTKKKNNMASTRKILCKILETALYKYPLINALSLLMLFAERAPNEK